MNIPNRCPKCGDILVNDLTFPDKSTKECQKRVNHIFKVVLDSKDSLIIMHYKEIKSKGKAKFDISWNFVERRIFVGPYISIKGRTIGASTMTPGWDHKSTMVIPWFEPELSNFPKLLNKLKTYICFS